MRCCLGVRDVFCSFVFSTPRMIHFYVCVHSVTANFTFIGPRFFYARFLVFDVGILPCLLYKLSETRFVSKELNQIIYIVWSYFIQLHLLLLVSTLHFCTRTERERTEDSEAESTHFHPEPSLRMTGAMPPRSQVQGRFCFMTVFQPRCVCRV